MGTRALSFLSYLFGILILGLYGYAILPLRTTEPGRFFFLLALALVPLIFFFGSAFAKKGKRCRH